MLEEIAGLVVDSGAVEKSVYLQQKYLNKAKKAAAALKPNTYSKAMQELLLYTADRTK